MNTTSSNFICLLNYVLQVDNFDVKNKAETSKPDGGGTSVCRGGQKRNGCEPSEIELETFRVMEFSAIDSVSHLGPTELISKIDDAIAGSSRNVVTPIRTSLHLMLAPRSMLNNILMKCTLSRAHYAFEEMSSPYCVIFLHGK
ncbi:hypothetical protein PVK06_002913 [Gossypium arboreum]|uniref:Uncharacterized protein n=1 Tax=Gossypium arboreum TaxID=29729 RepID=A0ABR0R617_GOSAR|nr:hypothetical protein PVK06_002913 [Gossypium arboreum]